MLSFTDAVDNVAAPALNVTPNRYRPFVSRFERKFNKGIMLFYSLKSTEIE